ncbi:hypothetical protein LTR15_005388 [Elasticomyces elasticus]|nr:hypothetical protein LTR15_005388 [Elasticomyces elasticus]
MVDVPTSRKRPHGEIDRPHSVTSGPPKRPKTQRVRPRPNHEEQKSKTLSMFDLPAELRNAIYECFFDDLVAKPKAPFAQLPDNARFGQYANLMRTSRQIRKEARSLFMQDCADKVTYYFTNGLNLVNFVSRTRNFEHGILRNASFLLCQYHDLDMDIYDDDVKTCTESLIEIQPGFQALWNVLPVGTFYLLRMSKALLEGDHAKANGFEYFTDDTYCAGPGRCTPKRSLEWPTLAGGCQLTYHSWYVVPNSPKTLHPVELSCVTLEGRLACLSTRPFDLDEANQAAAHAADEPCDVEPCHECDCGVGCICVNEDEEEESKMEVHREEPEEELVGGDDEDYDSDSEH